MTATLEACAMEDEAPEITELREILEEYEELYELCMTTQLTDEEQETLEDHHRFLRSKEREFWGGVDYEVLLIIEGESTSNFPMVRNLLGLLPFEI